MQLSYDDQLNQAFAQYAQELSAFVYDRIDVVEAEDVLQDIWAAFAATLAQETIVNPRAWLYRALRNRLTDKYRLRTRRPVFTNLDQVGDFAETPSFNDLDDPDIFWETLFAALDTLPEKQRIVFVRNELDGETLSEIAEDLGISLKTIISRKQYAKNRLREALHDFYDEYLGE